MDIDTFEEFDLLLPFAIAANKQKLDFNRYSVKKMLTYQLHFMLDRRRNPEYYYDCIAAQVKIEIDEEFKTLLKPYKSLLMRKK